MTKVFDIQSTDSSKPKAKFSAEEDARLLSLVAEHGARNWIHVSSLMQQRNPRQCRERWKNYLRPELRSDPFSPEEDTLLEQKFSEYGPKWNTIAKYFVNRSDNSLRNRWMMIDRRCKKQKVPKESQSSLINARRSSKAPENAASLFSDIVPIEQLFCGSADWNDFPF